MMLIPWWRYTSGQKVSRYFGFGRVTASKGRIIASGSRDQVITCVIKKYPACYGCGDG